MATTLFHAVGGGRRMPTNWACLPPCWVPTLCAVHVGGWKHAFCVLTFLEPHDCPLSIFFHHHLAEEKEESSHRALRAGSEMAIATSQCAGMPCAAGCRGHAHAVPQWSNLPSSPPRLNEGGECATMQQSRCRDGVVDGEREQQREEKRRGRESTTSHSHMYHLLLVFTGVACRWRRTCAAGGGTAFPLYTGPCMGVSWGMYVRRGGLSEWSSGGVVVVVSQINGDDGVYGCGVVER